MKPPAPIDAILAGSKGFALALLAPLAERIGSRPRVATDPAQALAFCSGPTSLVVVEFQGEDSLRAIQHLVLQGNGIRIVAAVSSAHVAAEGPLRALGVEFARWDGNPEAVLGAVARRLAAPAPGPPTPIAPQRVAPPASIAPPVLTPSKPAVARPAAKPAAAPPPSAAALFDDLAPAPDADGFDVDVDEAILAPALAAGPWPTAVPGPVEAADALGRGLAGKLDPPGTPFGSVKDVLGSLSEIERAVLSGVPQPVDTEAIRRAAVMRVRVACALATAPAAAGAVDTGAVSALLAEIDALLADVNTLAQGAPPDLQSSLEAVRNALVREAIDFSEAAQRAAPVELAGTSPSARAPSARAAQARMISVSSTAEKQVAEAETGRQRRLFVVLGVAAVAAVAFHGYRYWLRTRGWNEPATRAGAPARALVVSGPRAADPVLVHSGDGKPFSRAELNRLVEEERLRGNAAQELGPGVVLITPAPQPASQPPATPREVKP